MTVTSTEIGSITAEHARLVLDVTRALAVTTDLDALLKKIAEAARELLSCERTSIFVHDPATDQLWTKVALQTTEIRLIHTGPCVLRRRVSCCRGDGSRSGNRKFLGSARSGPDRT